MIIPLYVQENEGRKEKNDGSGLEKVENIRLLMLFYQKTASQI